MTAVSVDHLIKRFPRRPVNAVDGVSFEVRRGVTFGMLGPNRAGKTRLVDILTTAALPSAERGHTRRRRRGLPTRSAPGDISACCPTARTWI